MESNGTSLNKASSSPSAPRAIASFVKDCNEISPVCSKRFNYPRLTPDLDANSFWEIFFLFRSCTIRFASSIFISAHVF